MNKDDKLMFDDIKFVIEHDYVDFANKARFLWCISIIEELHNENKRLRKLMRKAFDACADVACELELPRDFCQEAIKYEEE
jgi:hypothetical protein